MTTLPSLLRRSFTTLGLALLFTLSLSLSAAAQDLPVKFDPARDGAKDVATAVAQAKAQGKRVLVDVGANGVRGATSWTVSSPPTPT